MTPKGIRTFWKVLKFFCKLSWWLHDCTHLQLHRQLKHLNFIICKLHLSKYGLLKKRKKKRNWSLDPPWREAVLQGSRALRKCQRKQKDPDWIWAADSEVWSAWSSKEDNSVHSGFLTGKTLPRMSTSLHRWVSQERPDYASTAVTVRSEWFIIRKFSFFLNYAVSNLVWGALLHKPSGSQVEEVSPAYSWPGKTWATQPPQQGKVELEHHALTMPCFIQTMACFSALHSDWQERWSISWVWLFLP